MNKDKVMKLRREMSIRIARLDELEVIAETCMPACKGRILLACMKETSATLSKIYDELWEVEL